MKKKVSVSQTGVGGGRTFALIFLFFFAIMLCAPMSYDDFEFADVARGSLGEMVDYSLSYGNGRALGNIGGVVLQTARPLAALAKAIVITGLVYLVPGVLGIHSGAAVAVSFLVFAGMEPGLFAQAFTWTSGFCNYVPPVFLSLLALYLMQQYPAVKGHTGKKLAICFALLLLGFAGQLYAEHSLVVHLALAVVVLLKTLVDKTHRSLLPAAVFLLAVLAGTIFHLEIPGLFVNGYSHTDGYRAIHLYNLKDTIFCCARNFLRLSNQYCGLLGLPVCLGGWFAGKRTSHRRSEKANRWQRGLCIFSAGYMLLTRLTQTNGWFGELGVPQEALEAVIVVLALFSWLWALLTDENSLHRNRELTLLGFALFALAPLLVVHPLGYRVQFHSYVFVLLACFHSGAPVVAGWKPEILRAGKQLARGACLLLALCLGATFYSIHTIDKARTLHIRREMEAGATEIFICRYPMEYVHDTTDPLTGMYYYYETQMDIEFPILTFDDWQGLYSDVLK